MVDIFLQKQIVSVFIQNLTIYDLKSQNPLKLNCRCVVCGDSKKSKHKMRMWIYEKNNNILTHCFNCGYSNSFSGLLKSYYNNLYNQLIFSSKFDKKPIDNKTTKASKQVIKENDYIKSLTKAIDDSTATKFLLSRKIPNQYFSQFYFTSNFYSYINSIIPEKFSKKALKYDHPRIVIPFFDILGGCFGVQGRSISDTNSPKYITVLFKEYKKIYGIDRIDFSKTCYCVEGPIDSLFLDNSVAMAGADIKISKDFVIVFDNEPRNKQIINRYEKYINNGYKVCIWPDYIKEKDINDMIISGYTKKQIKDIVDKSTKSGILAKIEFQKWKRV